MSAVTGTETAAAIAATVCSIRSREISWPSGNPLEKATPALVVAIAFEPAFSIIRADATSHALTRTRGWPGRCRLRRVSAFEARPEGIGSISLFRRLWLRRLRRRTCRRLR